jgi:hypothetical protein
MGGQPKLAHELSRQIRTQLSTVPVENDAQIVVGAVFLDGDSLDGASSGARLRRIAMAQGSEAPTSEVVYAAWYAGLWDAYSGNRSGAAELARRLRQWAPLGSSASLREAARIGAEMLEMMIATNTAESRRRVMALDAVMQEGPILDPMATGVINLLVSRGLAQAGLPDRAARAAGRWHNFDPLLFGEQFDARARQSLVIGDTAAAIRDWQLYLQLRVAAEPAVRAKDEVIRAELARLVGERPPGTP